MKRIEDLLSSIVMVLIDMFDIIWTCNISGFKYIFTMDFILSNMDE